MNLSCFYCQNIIPYTKRDANYVSFNGVLYCNDCNIQYYWEYNKYAHLDDNLNIIITYIDFSIGDNLILFVSFISNNVTLYESKYNPIKKQYENPIIFSSKDIFKFLALPLDSLHNKVRQLMVFS